MNFRQRTKKLNDVFSNGLRIELFDKIQTLEKILYSTSNQYTFRVADNYREKSLYGVRVIQHIEQSNSCFIILGQIRLHYYHTM